MRPSPLAVQGMSVPWLLYGTAWKEDATEALTGQALVAGFRGIDTANQRKHYQEAGVGAALKAAFKQGVVRRDEVFLQTKFTHVDGQDHRLPYDAAATADKQVGQSFASSLEHLGIETVDSYLLHGPSVPGGWAEADLQAWGAMEDLQRSGRARLIGVSNVSATQLELIHAKAAVKPAIVQNRTFTRPDADKAVRDFCKAKGLAYQGFSLLTGHGRLMSHPLLHAMAERVEATVPQIVFRYCKERGIHVLAGTTSPQHMAHDVAAADLVLKAEDLAVLDRLVC